MSSRKRKPIFGPDGKPLDLDRLHAEAHEKRDAEQPKTTQPPKYVDVVHPSFLGVSTAPYQTNFMDRMMADLLAFPAVKAPSGPSLRDVVAEQVTEMTADLDFVGGEELPRPPADLTTYADAFEAAVRDCKHPNTTNLLYQRQWQCDDCGRYLDKAAYKKSSGGGLGWMFGG